MRFLSIPINVLKTFVSTMQEKKHVERMNSIGLLATATAEKKRIKVLTFNVQCYERASPDQIVAFIEESNADVVCMQEHVSSVQLPLKKYSLVSLCTGEKTKDNKSRVSNAILITKQLSKQVKKMSTDVIKFAKKRADDVERCATIVCVDGICIANVHLTGGRIDDKQFRTLAAQKADQVETLVRAAVPDVIVGDFNAESNDVEALRTLATYPLFLSLGDVDKELFLNYYLAGHKRLQTMGYFTALSELATRPTSIYGGVPDWVYTQKGGRARVVGYERLNTLPHLSDHNALLAIVELESD